MTSKRPRVKGRLPTIEDLIAQTEEVADIAEQHGDRRGLVYALRATWYLRRRQAELALAGRADATVH